ncbi:hypothetical protein ACS0TY_032532 [Phlomoides rotata]
MWNLSPHRFAWDIGSAISTYDATCYEPQGRISISALGFSVVRGVRVCPTVAVGFHVVLAVSFLFYMCLVAMASPEELGDDVLDLGTIEDRPFNVFALMDVMIKDFKSRTKVAVRELGNKLLIFTFADEKDRDWVIRNQRWHFDGHLFIIKSLDGSE